MINVWASGHKSTEHRLLSFSHLNGKTVVKSPQNNLLSTLIGPLQIKTKLQINTRVRKSIFNALLSIFYHISVWFTMALNEAK